MQTHYTTLLMDADETLLDFRRSEETALRDACDYYHLPFTEALHDRYYAINQALWKLLETGGIERARLKVRRFEEFLAAAGVKDVDAAALNDRYMRRLGQHGFVMDGALEAAAALSKQYTLYIITNGSASVQHTRLADSGLLPFVRDVFISEEVGANKPSKAYFEYVLAHIEEQDRERLLVIGDSLTSDIRGGMNAALDTCWLNAKNDRYPPDIVPTYEIHSLKELCEWLV